MQVEGFKWTIFEAKRVYQDTQITVHFSGVNMSCAMSKFYIGVPVSRIQTSTAILWRDLNEMGGNDFVNHIKTSTRQPHPVWQLKLEV